VICRSKRAGRVEVACLLFAVALVAAAFSGQVGMIGSTASDATSAAEPTVVQGDRPAELSSPVEPADGAYLIAGGWTSSLKAAGYEQREYFASGTAYSYEASGPENDAGTWKVAPSESAPYRTRIVVRTPTSPSRFNGTVVVEWLNVSGGGDGAVDSVYLSPELERAGYAWVGVSAQVVGVDNLRQQDPARYGSLTDPGDQFSYDIYTQAARALLGAGGSNPLAPLHPKRLLAVGESQSALYMTTYIDAIQPLYHTFDGFLVHSRAGGAIPISGGSPSGGTFGGAVRIRTDIGVPILLMITETDEIFGQYYRARQPDTRFIRLWDVAGASHADSYIVAPSELQSLGCSSLNQAPSHFIFEAALSAIDSWLRSGVPPPSAPRMYLKEVNGAPTVQTNANGIAIGGIQGPWEKVPVAAYSGKAPAGAPGFCVLFGSTRPLGTTQLNMLYGSKADYLKAYARATDEEIRAGYILPADKGQVLAFARQVQF
jgi:Alpha/beta hydrolase domain